MNEMKKVILTMVVLAVSVSAIAQSIYADSWDPDANADGNVGVTDLLALLSVFGDYDLDNDGIWDSVDDCVGAYDECGVCNGAGILEGFCSCDGLSLDAIGECGGNCLEDYDGDGICDEFSGPCFGAEEITYFGHSYELVEIGEQCWFKDNLRTPYFNDGTEISLTFDDNDWYWTTQPAYCYYNDSEVNISDHGFIYNGPTLLSELNVCPTGWHVPTDGEFIELEIVAGMDPDEVYSPGWRGMTGNGGTSGPGYVLKSTSLWDDFMGMSGNGSDSLGFQWHPSGTRISNGNYAYLNESSFLWTAPENGISFIHKVVFSVDGIERFPRDLNNDDGGFSIRCLKDSE